MLSYRFRWAYCQLEILRQCLPPSVRRVLDELPETLDETYERVLKDIKKVNREHAIRLLHCLTVAVRPLRVEELAEVLAIDFDAARREGIPKLNPNWRWTDQHQAVLSTCSSLIVIVDDGDSQVVQFSHFSVKEYLTSDRLARLGGDVSHYHILLEPAHTILAQACLGILLSLDDRVNSINAGNIPLAKYAAKHWVDHARFENVTTRLQVAMECFFDANKPHHAAWLRVHDIDEEWFWFTPDCIIPCGEPLYYAALCGFYDLVKHLAVKHPENVNARGGQIVSPLGAALYRNHFQVAELLHEHRADVHVRGDWERTLLHASTKEGSVDAVRWLLDHGVDANARQDDGWTSLHLAAFNSHLEIARILLEHGADVDARNDDGEAPLHRAACPRDYHDHVNTMRLLLEHGPDVNARDNEGSTPLHCSSSKRGGDRTHPTKGTVEGTRLLLKYGASIDAENSRGETPRQVALIDEHHIIAEFLLECGAK
jgi:ankyrin repeat protein